jgi:hypothetical protein
LDFYRLFLEELWTKIVCKYIFAVFFYSTCHLSFVEKRPKINTKQKRKSIKNKVGRRMGGTGWVRDLVQVQRGASRLVLAALDMRRHEAVAVIAAIDICSSSSSSSSSTRSLKTKVDEPPVHLLNPRPTHPPAVFFG